SRRSRPLERVGEATKVAAGVDGVGGAHEEGRRGARVEGSPNGVRRAEDAGLAHVANVQGERRAVADKLLDLLRPVAGDDGDDLAPGRTELTQERGDHRAPVDRKDRL